MDNGSSQTGRAQQSVLMNQNLTKTKSIEYLLSDDGLLFQ